MRSDIKEGGPRHETASTMMTPTTDSTDYNRGDDKTVDITSIPLSSADENRLVELESEIESKLHAFIAVGSALAEIQGSKLYRATHATFEAYLSDRWGISRGRGYQLITAARVSTTVSSAGLPAPANEAQARALATVPDDHQVELWGNVVKNALASGPTANDIKDAADKMPPSPRPPRRPRRRRPLPDAFRDGVTKATKAANSLANLVVDERWDANLEQVRGACRSDVERLIAALENVRFALDGSGSSERWSPARWSS